MVVSCADPGIFASGEGGSEKTSDNVFRHRLILQRTRKTIFKDPEGIQHFLREGVQIFPGVGGGGGEGSKC